VEEGVAAGQDPLFGQPLLDFRDNLLDLEQVIEIDRI
jgi:hypothetical protein